MDCVAKTPQPGEPSYELFAQEKAQVLGSLAARAKSVAETFNSMPGMQCNAVQGAMYAFPHVSISRPVYNFMFRNESYVFLRSLFRKGLWPRPNYSAKLPTYFTLYSCWNKQESVAFQGQTLANDLEHIISGIDFGIMKSRIY